MQEPAISLFLLLYFIIIFRSSHRWALKRRAKVGEIEGEGDFLGRMADGRHSCLAPFLLLSLPPVRTPVIEAGGYQAKEEEEGQPGSTEKKEEEKLSRREREKEENRVGRSITKGQKIANLFKQIQILPKTIARLQDIICEL